MRRKILGIVLALALVFSTTTASFAATEKVSLEVTSGNTTIKAVATSDYVVKASVTGTMVDQASVTAKLAMTNVAGLDVEGTKSAEFTAVTGLASSLKEYDEYVDPADFTALNIKASVNEKAFEYNVEKDTVAGADYAWVAKPVDAAAVSAAWAELTNHVKTYDATDSKVIVKKGTVIQLGTEVLTFESDLTVDDINAQGDDMTGKIQDAVVWTQNDDGDFKVYLPAGSALQVGTSGAELTSGATILVDGVELDVDLTALQAAVDSDNAEAMIVETLKLVGVAYEAVCDTDSVTVTITTDCYKNGTNDCECDCDGCYTAPSQGGETPDGPSTPAETPTETPDTGDNTPVALFGAIMLACMIAAAAVIGTKKVRVK